MNQLDSARARLLDGRSVMIDTRVKLRIARHTDRLDEVAAFWRVNAQAYADPDGFLLLLAVSS